MPSLLKPHLELLDLPGLVRTLTPGAWRNPEKGYVLTLPVGLVSDGASVPNSGWPFLVATPLEMLPPGLFHDYLVRIGAKVDWQSPADERPLDAELAIEIMADVMEWCGIGEWDRACVTHALRLTVPAYWQKKPVDWDGTSEPRF